MFFIKGGFMQRNSRLITGLILGGITGMGLVFFSLKKKSKIKDVMQSALEVIESLKRFVEKSGNTSAKTESAVVESIKEIIDALNEERERLQRIKKLFTGKSIEKP